jgi:cytochrome oxidase Cu insertion factor (SCO1/SenC/PrrC family)
MSSGPSRHLVDEQAHAQVRELALVKRPWWLWGVCVLVALGSVALFFLAGFHSGSWRAGNNLQRLGDVPDFALLERSGQQVTKTDLLGKVWIASVIFTRCVDECPLVSSHMARLQDAFAAERDVRLVSITVDPVYDTPDVLTRYAQRFAAQPQRWLFLTGDKEAIYRLVRAGFHLGLMDPREAEQPGATVWAQEAKRPSSAVPEAGRWRGDLWQWLIPASAWAHHDAPPHDQVQQAITHSARLVLVDRQGQIRQYYNSADQDALHRVPRDVRLLLQGR